MRISDCQYYRRFASALRWRSRVLRKVLVAFKQGTSDVFRPFRLERANIPSYWSIWGRTGPVVPGTIPISHTLVLMYFYYYSEM